MSAKYCLVYSTCPATENHSDVISKALIVNKLAACVNIIDNISSIYSWKNQLETHKEKLLIIKTTLTLFDKVKEKIIQLHPYDCPEIIAVPITAGNQNYFSWIDNCLT